MVGLNKMKNAILIITLLYISNVFALNYNDLIVQGKGSVTFDIVDGFMFTIPSEKRAGFFIDPQHIDSTLKTLLTMSHIVNYGIREKIIDKVDTNKLVEKYLSSNNLNISYLGLSDLDYVKLKAYLILKQSFMSMHEEIEESIEIMDFSVLAKERYDLNLESYYHDDIINLEYINIRYTEKNKKERKVLAKEIQNKLRINHLDFEAVMLEYKEDKKIEYIGNINEYSYDKSFKEFSDYVFKPTEIGLIEEILDAKTRFIVSSISKIIKKGYKDFIEVKPDIMHKIKKEKAKRDYENLIYNLTKNEIEVNEESIISLRSRYLPKTIN